MGATTSMAIPMVAASGVRQTVNAGLTPAQTTWNLRSALNVAALNCQAPEHASLVDNYGAKLKIHARELSATNRALESEFRQRYGATFRDVQDSYMTQVYNYFALPPAKNQFCDVATNIAGEVVTVSPGELSVFAATALPRIETVFEDFFRAYEQYRVDLRAWNSQYGPPTVTTTVQGYTNPLDPAVTVAPGATVVDSMPATAPVPATGEAQAPVDLPLTTGQTPIVIGGESPADGTTTLPTEGPIFQSGEVVQGEVLQGEAGTVQDIVSGEEDDTPVP